MIEPKEKNITTLNNFSSKWENELVEYTPIPTALTGSASYLVLVYEGVGYSVTVVYNSSL